MSNKSNPPLWAGKVVEALHIRKMEKRELAAALDMHPSYLSGMLSGTRTSENNAKRICNYLGIER
jgi:DNA-binding Xre family transcriptional regulator